MQPVVLDIVARRVVRSAPPGPDGFDPHAFEIRLQDGAWTAFVAPTDAAWLSESAALMAGDAEAGRVLGERLAERLELAGWSACAPRLLRAIRAGLPVRVRVKAPDAAVLALPWSWLPLTPGGEPIGLQPGITVQRAWDGAAAAPRAAVARRASQRGCDRLVVAWGGEPGAADAVATALLEAARAGGRPLDAARDRMDRVSVDHLDRHLRAEAQKQQPVTVLHLQAEASADGGLLLRSQGGPSSVGPEALRNLLAAHAGTVRLAVVVPVEGVRRVDTAALGLAAHRAGVPAVVSSRWPLRPAAAACLAEALYGSLLAGSRSVEEALGEARAALREAGFPAAAAGLLFCAHAAGVHRPISARPWPGLLPYAPHEAPFFAGRETEVDRLTEALERLESQGRRRLLVVSGARGSGLRSLVRAGLAPRLAEERGGRLVWARAGSPLAASSQPRVVVLEDLLDLLDSGDSGRLTAALWAAAGEAHTVVLLPVPSELLGRCGELAIDGLGTRLDTLTTDEAHHVMLRAPGPRALQQMVEVPARAAGLEVESGLSVRIAAEVGQLRQPLPRLGALMAALWEAREGRALTKAAYEAVGGAAGVIAHRADALLEGLGDEPRAAAHATLVALAGAGRAPLPRLAVAELARLADLDPPAVERALHTFEDHRLVTRDAQGRVALASVALVEQWPRLQRWLATAKAPAPAAAAPPRAPVGRGWMVAAAAVLAVVVGLGSAWASRETAQAFLGHAVEDPLRDPTVSAVQLRQIREPADPAAWTTAARLVLGEPLAAAVAGPWDSPVTDVRFRADGRAALARAGDELVVIDPATGVARPVPIEAPVLAGALAPDGPALLALDRQGRLWRWDPSAAPEALFELDDPGPVVAAFSPSGDTALLATPARWTLLDPRGAVLATGPMPLEGEVPRVAVVADGGVRHVVAGQTGSVLMWSADQPDPNRLRHPGVRQLRLNAAATHLLTLGDGRLRITDLVRGTGVSRTPSSVRVEAAAFDPEGSWLAVDYTEVESDAHRARRLRVDQRADQFESEPLDAPAVTLVTGPEAQRVFRGLTDGTVEERDLETGALLRQLRGHAGRVHHLRASPDGRWLASASADGTVRLWDIAQEPAGPPEADDPDALRAALWEATSACAGLADASPEAWCECERCHGREPDACAGVPGGLKGVVASVMNDPVCEL